MYKRRITRCFDCNKLTRPSLGHKLYFSSTPDGKDKPVVLCDDCFVNAGFYLKRHTNISSSVTHEYNIITDPDYVKQTEIEFKPAIVPDVNKVISIA